MPIISTPPPPKTPRAPKTGTPPKSVASDKTAERSEGLRGWCQIAEAILIGFRQYADAATITTYGPPLSEEIANLAADNDKIAALVDPIVSTGPYGALLAITIPMGAQLAVNHGLLKAGAMGTVPRETLSARVEASLARAQADALRAQQAAEEETERLQEEIARSRAVVPSRVVK